MAIEIFVLTYEVFFYKVNSLFLIYKLSYKQRRRETELEDKRKFERFELSVITRFGPSAEATQHSLGLTKNFSREGLSVEARDFSFTPDENLELELRSPEDNTTVSLNGNVVWKRQGENTNIAGIKLIFEDDNIQNEILEKISTYGNIPRESVFHSAEARESGFVKQYLDSGECEVTFRLLEEAAQGAQDVTIVGDFNNWDTSATPMTRLEDGGFQITLNLSPKKEYRFRYLIDGTRWENDWHADKYIPNDYGSDDSVVII